MRKSARKKAAKPKGSAKRTPVTVKFDDEELRLIEEAAYAAHDKRANWLRRMGLEAAEILLGKRPPPSRPVQ